MNIWGDETGRLLRLTVPAQNIDVAREDIASVASRQVTISRPNDELVRIPSNGFSLAGTLSKPAEASTMPRPAVVLTAGSGPADRDGLAFGIPTLGELAGALADAGFVVLRYDKRGIGQSGGRAEAASLADFADDQRAAVKFLTSRKDVDQKRIAVVGHSEGGLVALLAAGKEKRIVAVVLIATPGTTGAELVLAQQAVADRPVDAEKQSRTICETNQRRGTTGKGLDTLPPEMRRQVDNVISKSPHTTPPRIVLLSASRFSSCREADTRSCPPTPTASKRCTRAQTAGHRRGRQDSGVNHLRPSPSRRSRRIRDAAGQAHQRLFRRRLWSG